jgi:hypothetical protein
LTALIPQVFMARFRRRTTVTTILKTPVALTVQTRTAWSGCAFRAVPAYL